MIVWPISKRRKVLWHYSTYCRSLRPFHSWLRLLSPHILYSTHSTLCLFTSYHPFTRCWWFTLVVHPLLTTIAHHIFSSVLAEPQTDDKIHVSNSVVVNCLSVVYIRLDYKYVIICTKYHALDSTSNHSMDRVMWQVMYIVI